MDSSLRFAALGMTGRRGWIIATIPFCLPLSAPAGGEIVVDCTVDTDTLHGPGRGA